MKLLVEVWALIIENRLALIRLLLPVYLLGGAFVLTALSIVERYLLVFDDRALDSIWKGTALVFLVILLAGLGQVWLAVLWHRMALRPTGDGTFSGSYVRYLGALIVLFLVFLIIGILCVQLPMLLVLSAYPGLIFSPSGQFGFSLVSAAIWIVGIWLWMRLGLTLPSVAVGDDWIGFGASITLTDVWRHQLWAVAVFQGLVLWATDQVVGAISFAPAILGQAVWLLLWPIAPLVGLASLSVMYRDAVTRADGAH